MQEKTKEQKKAVTLDELLPVYYNANNQAKYFKDSASMLGEQIKSICLSSGVLKGEAGAYKYTVSKQTRQSLDEEVLMECVKKLPKSISQKLIKVKEYIDPAELERAVFMGIVKPEDIAPAQINKEVVALRVTKAK